MKAYLKTYGVRALILVLIAAVIVGLATRDKE